MTPEQSRRLASIIGLAVGDAVGTTNEFKALGSSTPLTDLVGGGPFALPAGACLPRPLAQPMRREADDTPTAPQPFRFGTKGGAGLLGGIAGDRGLPKGPTTEVAHSEQTRRFTEA